MNAAATTDVDQELNLLVHSKTDEAEDVVIFRLVASNGDDLPGFEAGAHIEVQAGTVGRRHYSLCNPSTTPSYYEIAVLRDPASRGGSRFMHEVLAPGAGLRVSVPRNHFRLAEEGPALLLAGGIGITPLFAMAQQLAREHRGFDLHYCTRSLARTAFHTRLLGQVNSRDMHFHFDDGAEAQKLDLPAVLTSVTPLHHLYVCGPSGFIKSVIDTAIDAGWSEQRIHREFFGAPAASAAHDADQTFELVLARSGRKLTVPSSRSALAILQSSGVDVMSSCETGVCGTCLTVVLDGTPDHRDMYLTVDERARNDSFTPCCSRARTTTLVIDL